MNFHKLYICLLILLVYYQGLRFQNFILAPKLNTKTILHTIHCFILKIFIIRTSCSDCLRMLLSAVFSGFSCFRVSINFHSENYSAVFVREACLFKHLHRFYFLHCNSRLEELHMCHSVDILLRLGVDVQN
jgi:hypothetical protein